MASKIDTFAKTKEYLVCVDSDGCAMDTMDIKHIRCFGPCMVKEWGLKTWEDEILARWNEINLYTMTRGINRFKGLAMALGEIDKKYCSIQGIEVLARWVEESKALSNDALEMAIQKDDKEILRKALAWSQSVNCSIDMLPEEDKKPFEGVDQALATAHMDADIAIVSSANLDAVEAEWERYGLLSHTDIVLAQDVGSKAYCINELLKKGYKKEHVLMCGDAPGDQAASEDNGVCYYPILARRESESWAEFREQALPRFLAGSYRGAYEEDKINEFRKNLGGIYG